MHHQLPNKKQAADSEPPCLKNNKQKNYKPKTPQTSNLKLRSSNFKPCFPSIPETPRNWLPSECFSFRG
jgi:hypothetical protein